MPGYSTWWGAGHPGCVMFLLDWAMTGHFSSGRVFAGMHKSEALALAVNGAISNLKERCIYNGEYISHRIDVAVISYASTAGSIFHEYPQGHPLRGRDLISIPELALHPLRKEIRNDIEITATGKRLEVPTEISVWVTPQRRGGVTSMCAALRLARDIAERWINDNHQHCFPPMVFNITDGAPSDGDPRPEAAQLRDLRTNDGHLLLFNCHLTSAGAGPIAYPSLAATFNTSHYFAAELFEMSSEMPERMREFANERRVAVEMKPGARGFVFDGDPNSLFEMIELGSAAPWPVSPS